LLEPLRGDREFAGELRVEIATLVNFPDERFPGGDGALGREARALGLLGGLLEFPRPLLQRVPLLLQFGERAAMVAIRCSLMVVNAATARIARVNSRRPRTSNAIRA
jgi:hypothetical protein